MTEKRPNHRPPKERTIETEMKHDFYTIYEVADLMKLHHTTIRRMIKSGELPAKKYGQVWRIKKIDLEQFTSV